MTKKLAFVLAACAAASAAAQTTPLPPVAEQIAAAVLPLPADMRATATVMGYKTAGKLEVIRPGTNGMHCLALYVVQPRFHVACYHEGLEPFMARGREIRAAGTADSLVDPMRFAEIKSGKLKMPAYGALYSLTAQNKAAWDPATGKATGASPLAVVYMPGATPESTGISAVPKRDGSPWLMFPGTAKAHIMIVGSMGQ